MPSLQGGPLPVIIRVKTSLLEVINPVKPVTSFFFRPFVGIITVAHSIYNDRGAALKFPRFFLG